MRKFISAILAILVLVLSCIPCSDVAATHDVSEGAALMHATTGEHGEDHDHSIELCTPFCTCACCASTALPVYHNILLRPAAPVMGPAYAGYLPQMPMEVLFPIWQPPQLA